MTTTSADAAKVQARRLRQDLSAAGVDVPHALALELVAHVHGARDWNTLAARTGPSHPRVPGGAVPVLRMVTADVTLPFYVHLLGFTVDWEHRFGPGAPLYVQVSRGDLVLHLSEHHGDGTPGTVVWAPVADVDRLRDDIHARADGRMRPGVDPDAPGGPTLEVIDPNGNVLRFAQPGGGG